MLFKSFFAASLAATALADLTSINNVLVTIDTKLQSLNKTLNGWKGDLFGAVPILVESWDLESTITGGTKTAQSSTALSFNDTLVIADSTANVAIDAHSTLAYLITLKPKFDAIVVGTPFTLDVLKTLRNDTAGFAAAVVAKVPSDLQPVAQELVGEIDADFATAVKAYGG